MRLEEKNDRNEVEMMVGTCPHPDSHDKLDDGAAAVGAAVWCRLRRHGIAYARAPFTREEASAQRAPSLLPFVRDESAMGPPEMLASCKKRE